MISLSAFFPVCFPVIHSFPLDWSGPNYLTLNWNHRVITLLDLPGNGKQASGFGMLGWTFTCHLPRHLWTIHNFGYFTECPFFTALELSRWSVWPNDFMARVHRALSTQPADGVTDNKLKCFSFNLPDVCHCCYFMQTQLLLLTGPNFINYRYFRKDRISVKLSLILVM